jgi:hypothetical protein
LAHADDSWQKADSSIADANHPADSHLRWRAYHPEHAPQTTADSKPTDRKAKVVQAQWVAAAEPLPNPFADEPDVKNQKADRKASPAPAPGPATEPGKSSSSDPFHSDQPKTRGDRTEPAPLPATPGNDLGTQPKAPYVSPAPLTEPAIEPNTTTSQSKCDEELLLLRQNTIDKVQIDITLHVPADQQIPGECTLGNAQFIPRGWPGITYTWKASALCHKPLYFEEPQLERYGHSRGPIIDPLFSAAHFFVCVPLLPYSMGVEPPHECIYSLGYYRPGSCAPWIIDGFPISLRGLALECTAATGAAFAIP